MSLIPGHDFYGGAMAMRLSDANGVPYMSCCTTRHSDGLFAFRVFRGTSLEEVPLNPVCTGRGSMNLAGWWCAAQGKEWFNGAIPGFAPHPVGGTDARVDALIGQMASLNLTIDTLRKATVFDPRDRTALDRIRLFLGL